MPGDDDVIRASELGQYAFCSRAWWLGRVKGYRSSNVAAMEAGSAGHQVHGRRVEGAYRLRRLALALLILAGLILVAAAIAWLAAAAGG